MATSKVGKTILFGASLLAGLALIGTAVAAITFDSSTGTGFVGKGDVQYTFGWNNGQLQANAPNVRFRVSSEEVTEVSWICTNSNNDHTQERERTTTTTIEGLVASVARERNQVTGFNLTGYSGSVSQSTTTDGPPLNSCPANPSTWSLTSPAGDPELISSSGGGFEVSSDGGATWTALLEKP